MTKRHFEALADALAEARPLADQGAAALICWERTVGRIANVCAASNGRFDRGRFLNAVSARADKIGR